MTDLTYAHKKATNLTLSAKTLEAARELGMNISQTVDELLQKEVQRRTVLKWAEEHAATVTAYNERIQKNGLWNADLREMRGQI